MKIYAPNKQANGVYASVLFVDGVGETDSPKLIDWFKSHGYTLEKSEIHHENHIENVEKCEKPLIETQDLCEENKVNLVIDTLNDEVKPNFDEMTPNEIRQWATENGYGSKIRNTRNKEKLLEILRG